jgi:hypothetical protein
MKPTTKNFLKEVARQKGTKTNLKTQKVALSKVSDIVSETEANISLGNQAYDVIGRIDDALDTLESIYRNMENPDELIGRLENIIEEIEDIGVAVPSELIKAYQEYNRSAYLRTEDYLR